MFKITYILRLLLSECIDWNSYRIALLQVNYKPSVSILLVCKEILLMWSINPSECNLPEEHRWRSRVNKPEYPVVDSRTQWKAFIYRNQQRQSESAIMSVLVILRIMKRTATKAFRSFGNVECAFFVIYSPQYRSTYL